MTEKEKSDLKRALKEYKKEVTSSKKASQKFLVELGVFTKKGNVRKEYKNLCIPPDQV
jgi:hypothetical protein